MVNFTALISYSTLIRCWIRKLDYFYLFANSFSTFKKIYLLPVPVQCTNFQSCRACRNRLQLPIYRYILENINIFLKFHKRVLILKIQACSTMMPTHRLWITDIAQNNTPSGIRSWQNHMKDCTKNRSLPRSQGESLSSSPLSHIHRMDRKGLSGTFVSNGDT
jgi:hypothetical protein